MKQFRPSWNVFVQRTGPNHFRRMLCMPLCIFSILCLKISESVGEDTVLSKSYIEARYPNNADATLPYISG